MRIAVFTWLLLLLCGSLSEPARGQVVPIREAARDLLRPDVREKLVASDSVSTIETRSVPGGRIDADGVYRARYRVADRVPGGLGRAEAAIYHLERSARTYGIGQADEHLDVESVIDGRYASHVRLRQTLEGVPVYRREVNVSFDAGGQPTMILNGFAPHLEHVTNFDPNPTITRQQAIRIVQTAGTRGLDVTEPELVVYPSKPPRLAWKMNAEPGGRPIRWEALVDARTGVIILMLDQTVHAHGTVDLSRASSSHSPSQPRVEAVRRVDGLGYVFDPDPLSSAGVEYGPPYVDTNDDDVPELNAQLFEVTLRDITQGTDGMYRLEGPYVIIDGTSSGYVPPAEASPDGFRYTRANDYFEAVNVYYHIDKSQRHVQLLDAGFPIREEPILANPQASQGDESSYNGDNLLRFGTGGIDDGEDADVIWHEYAHALLDATARLSFDGETGAYHEGWADYWAASYSRYLSEGDELIPEHNWRKVFSWDGNTSSWCGRVLDHPGHYPDDTDYPGPACSGDDPKYEKGVLWATTMMDIYDDVGRDVLDRLHLASHLHLGEMMTFTDAAEALLQADLDLYDGTHSNILIHHLDERGYIDESQYGPVISHEPLTAVEQTGGTIAVEATVQAATADIETVSLFYGTDGAATNRLVLEPQGDGRYAGDLPIPQEGGTVTYYIEAVDANGRRRLLPAGAPAETFSFEAGPDDEPPVIVHDALEDVAVAGWPADLYALVDDNLGVDSVWVEYTVRGAGGAVLEESGFALSSDGTAYSGSFPVTANKVQAGYTVSYRIVARDASVSGNIASTPLIEVDIAEKGVLRAYDFEGINRGVEASGEWELGAPTYGLRVAHSGSRIWGTVLDGTYSSTPRSSELTLPALDIVDGGPVYLVFWHWYDFEHNGRARPGEFDSEAILWDGGIIEASIDGAAWTPLETEGGYNGTVSAAYGNPLGGERAFGGYSYGWRREVVELPHGSDVRVRFVMGTDNSNEQQTEYFAGWYVDDVTVTTSIPEDVTPPTATMLPDPVMTRVAGLDAPQISIGVQDDTGIAAVLTAFELVGDGGAFRDTVRLAMSPTDRDLYEGTIGSSQTFDAGDRIEYRIIVRDFDGNESVYGDPFVIEYRAEQRETAMRGVVSTGAWERQGNTWATVGSAAGSVSSLVLQPFTLPINGDRAQFLMDHSFNLGTGLGGNVKVSTDDGATWRVLEPAGGYPATFTPERAHAMAGQGIFQGSSGGSVETEFDLSEFAGSEVRIRIDLAHGREAEPEEGWFVLEATYRALTPDPEFETDRTLTLHANFPDPFVNRTNITYTIPEQGPVRLTVYDMLGRRVALLRHAEQEEGTYSMSFAADGLANGVYMLFLETPTGTRTERMVVAR